MAAGGEFPAHPQDAERGGRAKPPPQWPGALATFVVVAAAVFAVTAFWIPGFLMHKNPAPPPPAQTAPATPTADPAEVKAVKQTTGRVVKAFNAHDRTAMGKELCKGSMNILQNARPDERLATNGDPQINGKTAKVPMILTIKGNDKAGRVTFLKQSGKWCLKAGS